MQPHTPCCPTPSRRALALAALLLIGTVACSSQSVSTPTGPQPPGSAVLDPAGPSVEPATSADTDVAPAVEPGDENELSPICETVPPLDVISGVLGGPVATITDYSTPAIEVDGAVVRNDKCEATGDDVFLAIFERFDLAQGDALLADAAAAGATFAIADPRLAGAVGWANGVMIASDGVYWYATAITPTTIGAAGTAEAYAVSAALLAAWLGV